MTGYGVDIRYINTKSMDLQEEPDNLVFPAVAFLELLKRANKGIELDNQPTCTLSVISNNPIIL